MLCLPPLGIYFFAADDIHGWNRANNIWLYLLSLSHQLELGVIPIPKSVTQARVQQNIQLFDFSLTPEEKETLQKFDRGYRTIAVLVWKESPYYPFEKP